MPVEQGVGWRQDAHGLHPRATLQLTFHRHVGEAGQAEEGPLPEIAKRDPICSRAQNQEFGFFPLTGVLKSLQCPTLCTPMDCSPPGSSVMGILQARILEWVACPPPRDLLPGMEPASLMSPALAGRFFTTRNIWKSLEGHPK